MFIENTILAKKIEQEIVTRERFSRLLSPNVAEQVISGKLEVKQGGQLVQECTVFNSDIRGFTAMSEGTTAETMVEMLNEYFELMVETIFKYEGTLDKFMGDGIMALLGRARSRTPTTPFAACSARSSRWRCSGAFNRKRIELGTSRRSRSASGIHTGPLRRRLRRQLEGALVHGHRRHREHQRAPLRHRARRADHHQRVDPRAARRTASRSRSSPRAHLKGKEKPLRIFNVKREKLSAVAKVG